MKKNLWSLLTEFSCIYFILKDFLNLECLPSWYLSKSPNLAVITLRRAAGNDPKFRFLSLNAWIETNTNIHKINLNYILPGDITADSITPIHIYQSKILWSTAVLNDNSMIVLDTLHFWFQSRNHKLEEGVHYIKI